MSSYPPMDDRIFNDNIGGEPGPGDDDDDDDDSFAGAGVKPRSCFNRPDGQNGFSMGKPKNKLKNQLRCQIANTLLGGSTQSDIANRAGFSIPKLCLWLKDRGQDINLSTADKLIDACDEINAERK